MIYAVCKFSYFSSLVLQELTRVKITPVSEFAMGSFHLAFERLNATRGMKEMVLNIYPILRPHI